MEELGDQRQEQLILSLWALQPAVQCKSCRPTQTGAGLPERTGSSRRAGDFCASRLPLGLAMA